MPDLVGNPEDRFSHNETHIKYGVNGPSLQGLVFVMTFLISGMSEKNFLALKRQLSVLN